MCALRTNIKRSDGEKISYFNRETTYLSRIYLKQWQQSKLKVRCGADRVWLCITELQLSCRPKVRNMLLLDGNKWNMSVDVSDGQIIMMSEHKLKETCKGIILAPDHSYITNIYIYISLALNELGPCPLSVVDSSICSINNMSLFKALIWPSWSTLIIRALVIMAVIEAVWAEIVVF